MTEAIINEEMTEIEGEAAAEEARIAQEIAEEAEADRFVIDDDSKADWAVKKIREAEAEIESWKDYYRRALEKIAKRQQSRIDYLKGMLAGYFDTVPHHETKTQASYQLPSGKLVLKQGGPQFKTDDATLVPWLKENGLNEFVKTEIKEKAAWGELKKTVTVVGSQVVTDDGEIVPGVTVEEQAPTFEVK